MSMDLPPLGQVGVEHKIDWGFVEAVELKFSLASRCKVFPASWLANASLLEDNAHFASSMRL